MLRALIRLISLLCLSSPGFTHSESSLYQVDLIVFTHQHGISEPFENTSNLPYLASLNSAIPLNTNTRANKTPYHTLPTSASQLRNEYWRLHHKPQYHVLFHYTWLQPSNNQRPISLSQTTTQGWHVEGTLQIQRSNYYLLNTDLLFSNAEHHASSFVLSQKQRLKPNVVYYLDHAQAGMLIKIHPIA